jgi:hypothetical protein
MRATYQNIKLPANFKYSETQAEKLGAMQFGFLDISTARGKKRMYATVRGGYAIDVHAHVSTANEDLAALKKVLAARRFPALKGAEKFAEKSLFLKKTVIKINAFRKNHRRKIAK